MALRRIGVEQRRVRLGLRHQLAATARADSAVAVARQMVALHGTDPASVYLAVLARLRAGDVDAVERALYDERVLARLLGMRRTMFVMERDVAGLVYAACTQAIAKRERRTLLQHLGRAITEQDVGAWLSDVEASTLRAVAARGEATAQELSQDEPRLRTAIAMAEGKPYAAQQYVSTRVLFLLAADGRIMRGRPRGSWTSSQFRWSLARTWWPDGWGEWSTDLARAELVRRWLVAFGPATFADVRWWTGLTIGETRKALAHVGPVEVDLDGATGLALAEDVDAVTAPEPWTALLPALDPTPMGWLERDWFLGDHAAALFDRTGNIGPTVWWNGRIVGGWAQRKTGEIAFRLLEDVGADALAEVARAAERLETQIGDVRVTPRFRTPLERELSLS